MSADLNPVGWFEIPVTDMGRAKLFYEHVFKIELEEHQIGNQLMAWFPWNKKETGCTGSLVKSDGYNPSENGVVVYFTSPDMIDMLERVKEKNGKVLENRFSNGEYGFVAMIRDSEGNRIGLHSRV